MPQTLELDATGVDRAAVARALGGALGRPTKLAMLWHDNGDGALAARGLALAERRESRSTVWQLAPLHSAPGAPTLTAEAASPDGLGGDLPAPLLPVAAFSGTRRSMDRDEIRIVLVQGEMRGIAATAPLHRLHLTGAPAAVVALAQELAGAQPLRVPPQSIACAAMQAAGRLGVVPHVEAGAGGALSAELSIGEACARLCAELAGALLWRGAQIAGTAAPVPRDPEPVHQMRVTLRRLRSALALFAPLLVCPDMSAAQTGLKALGAALGPARDWDVFAGETAASIAAAFPGETAIARLLAAAERRRIAAHAALRAHLAGADDRRLGIALASLASFSPWDTGAAAEPADAPAETLLAFASRALSRARHRLLAPGADIDALPEDALHAIRLRAKRLRYAAEMFAPLFPGRDTGRFLRRLAALQAALGRLNDGAVAAGLLAQLGAPAGHGFAAGLIRGYTAAHAPGTRRSIARAWRRLRRSAPFWK
jgi:CHAD domain-containing protein